jgi:predicted dienelactone hydrolase
MAIATAPRRPDVVSGAVVAAADVTRRYGEQETAADALRGVTIGPPRGSVGRGDGRPSRAGGFMMLMTRHALAGAALVIGVALLNRSRLLAALMAVTLGLGLSGQMLAEATAAEGAGLADDLRVGHKVKNIVVPGTELCPNPSVPCVDENRRVRVHLWYPADQNQPAKRPSTQYKSALHGFTLPEPWLPLSWKVDAEIARENAAVDPSGPAFPVIVFSHGNVNDPIDYAHTLELIAGAGFVVAAPYHVNNTQDDVRIDFINGQAGVQLFPCDDGRPSPCSHPDVPLSMADRVRDIAKVLDELPGWFRDRVDVKRAGVLGHSRGTATVLAAAGGTFSREDPRAANANCQASGALCWPLAPGQERGLSRVKAVMGLAIAAQRITRGVDLENVKVPALLVSGTLDQTSPPAVSQFAFERISSTEKALVSIPDATHRSFDSTYCAQMQAAAALADKEEENRIGNGDGGVDGPERADWKTRAILDLHTVTGIVSSPPMGLSGKAVHYCSHDFFTKPVNIGPLVESIPGSEFPPSVGPPSTGLDTDEVKHGVKELAVPFFGKALEAGGR